jgi:hypothetical protein
MPKAKSARDPHGNDITVGKEAYVVGMPPHDEAIMPEIRRQTVISISPNNHFAFGYHSVSGRPKYTDSRFVFHERAHAVLMIRNYLAEKAATDMQKLETLKERARESHGAMKLAQDPDYDFTPVAERSLLDSSVKAINERVRALGKDAPV